MTSVTSWLPLTSVFARAIAMRTFAYQCASIFAFAVLSSAFLLLDHAGSDAGIANALAKLPQRLCEIALPLGTLIGSAMALGISRRDASLDELENRGATLAWFAAHAAYATIPFALAGLVAGIMIGTSRDSHSLEREELVAAWLRQGDTLTLAIPRQDTCGLEHFVRLQVPHSTRSNAGNASDSGTLADDLQYLDIAGIAAHDLDCSGASITLSGLQTFGVYDKESSQQTSITWKQPASVVQKEWGSAGDLLYATAQSPHSLNTKRAVMQTSLRFVLPLLLPMLVFWLIMLLDRSLHSHTRRAPSWTAVAGAGAMVSLVLLLLLNARIGAFALETGTLSCTAGATVSLILLLSAASLLLSPIPALLAVGGWMLLDWQLVSASSANCHPATGLSLILGLSVFILLMRWQRSKSG